MNKKINKITFIIFGLSFTSGFFSKYETIDYEKPISTNYDEETNRIDFFQDLFHLIEEENIEKLYNQEEIKQFIKKFKEKISNYLSLVENIKGERFKELSKNIKDIQKASDPKEIIKEIKKFVKYIIKEIKKFPDTIKEINIEDVDQLFTDFNHLLREFLVLFTSDYQELFPNEKLQILKGVKECISLYDKHKWIIGSPGDFISFLKNANTTFGIGFILPDYQFLSILLSPLRLIFLYFPKLILSRAIFWYLSLENIYPYKIYEKKIKELKEFLKTIEDRIDSFHELNKS